jgi:hypothetical protein
MLGNLFNATLMNALFMFFEALSLFDNDPEDLNDFLVKSDSSKATVSVFDFDFSKLNEIETKKMRLRSSLGLVTNESVLHNFELMDFAGDVALLTHLMLNYTKLSSVLNEDGCVMFRDFMLKQYLIQHFNSHGICSYVRYETVYKSGKKLSQKIRLDELKFKF